MRRAATLLLGFIVALGVALPAHAAPQRYRYVADDGQFVLEAFVSSWTGLPVNGLVSFVPAADHETIVVTDVAPVANLPLVVNTAEGTRFECVGNGADTTLLDLVPGQRVWLYVLDAAHRGGCAVGGTTGTITLVG